MTKPHLGFKVHQYNPLRLWLALAVLVLLLVVMFLLGRAYQSYELQQLLQVEQSLLARIDELEQRNEQLVARNAQLARSSKIENDAYEEAKQSLVKLQQDMLDMQEQLVFYQGIVSPEELAFGVNVQSFELLKKNDIGLYSYKLVLTKRGKSNQFVKGRINMLVKGEQDGKQVDLAIKTIKQDYKDKDVKFSFRYFQVFEGDMLLPDSFDPYDIELQVKPTTKKIKNFTETILWVDALTGGNS